MQEPRIIKRDDIFGVFEVKRDRKKKVIFCIPITKGRHGRRRTNHRNRIPNVSSRCVSPFR
jgi:hypothetical protein